MSEKRAASGSSFGWGKRESHSSYFSPSSLLLHLFFLVPFLPGASGTVETPRRRKSAKSSFRFGILRRPKSPRLAAVLSDAFDVVPWEEYPGRPAEGAIFDSVLGGQGGEAERRAVLSPSQISSRRSRDISWTNQCRCMYRPSCCRHGLVRPLSRPAKILGWPTIRQHLQTRRTPRRPPLHA